MIACNSEHTVLFKWVNYVTYDLYLNKVVKNVSKKLFCSNEICNNINNGAHFGSTCKNNINKYILNVTK